MTAKEKKYLSDITNALLLIESFLNGIDSFEKYSKDAKTKSAVERQLGIIGEAVNRYLKETGKNQLIHSKRIISLRNRLIHAYDTIDDAIIWSILSLHLIPLKEEVEFLLNE